MGMDIDFFKFITEREYRKNEGKCGYSENEYHKSLGEVKTYTRFVKGWDWDFYTAFQSLGLDYKNYKYLREINCIHEFEHLKTGEIIRINNNDVPDIDRLYECVYLKEVAYISGYQLAKLYAGKDRIDDEVCELKEMIKDFEEMLYDPFGTVLLTRSRFEELLRHFPVVRRMFTKFFEQHKDLDYDVMYISW